MKCLGQEIKRQGIKKDRLMARDMHKQVVGPTIGAKAVPNANCADTGTYTVSRALNQPKLEIVQIKISAVHL